MSNTINNWTYTTPTKSGDYLVCFGDVETPKNVRFERFSLEDGQLRTSDGEPISYSSSYKFARLVYSPTEIKEIEDA